ncbi:MAG: hypothetical protein A2Z04_07485 [Chloroflexi bacterium RBG_16_57_9]|nr:MAG: hypothetical protein A2Z04_07485 [Chloroflexi bacterium RBG_16_57_9]
MTNQSDLAYRVLHLEQQLDAYQKLHAQELEEIRRALNELKSQLLAMGTTPQPQGLRVLEER